MFTLHCKPLYAPTDLDPHERLFTPARLRRHTHQTCLIIKPIPWGKSDRAKKWGTKSMRLYAIQDADLYDQLLADIGGTAGCYVLCSHDGARFLSIGRALCVDDEGILYIGAGEPLISRVMALRKALCAASGRGGYTDYSAHGCGEKYSRSWQQAVPFGSLKVVLHPTESGDAMWNREVELLRQYEDRYGEAPPLNETPPRRRGT